MISLITPFSSNIWCATVSGASGITQLASHLAAAEGHGRVKCNGRQARRHIKSKPTTLFAGQELRMRNMDSIVFVSWQSLTWQPLRVLRITKQQLDSQLASETRKPMKSVSADASAFGYKSAALSSNWHHKSTGHSLADNYPKPKQSTCSNT